MSKSLQAIRGMNDILPEQTPAWRYLERTFAGLLDGYGYSEIRLPILEFTELRPRHRRRHRCGRQGDVHLPRPQRRIPDHASGRYRRLRARRAGARPERRWPGAEALVHRADVPLRETAERSLPAVPPDRRGSLQPARSGHRRRVDHPHLAPVAEARHGRRGDPAAQHPRLQRGPRTLSRGPGGLSAGALSSNSTKTASGA